MTVKVDCELYHEFVRTDRHERTRKLIRTESYHLSAMRRWVHRKLKRLAQPGGIAFSWPPEIDVQRDPSIRANLWYAWTDYALLDGHPGEMFAAPRDKNGLPL